MDLVAMKRSAAAFLQIFVAHISSALVLKRCYFLCLFALGSAFAFATFSFALAAFAFAFAFATLAFAFAVAVTAVALVAYSNKTLI
jgi:hypothetical protein